MGGPAKRCIHGIEKRCCRECGGSKFCEHDRQKTRCKECGGGSICQHGQRKERCRECKGGERCRHGKFKYHCHECGGRGICEHGINKRVCRECNGSAFCVHGLDRARCKACGGSALCKHDIRKEYCKECGGSGLCQHGKQKHSCAECNNFLCDISHCPCVGHRFAGVSALLKHMRAQHSDNSKARTKTKELTVYQALQNAGLDFEYQKYIPFAGCSLGSETKHAFLDFVFVKTWGYLVLEVDEDQHKSYPASCDVRRDFDIQASVALGSNQKIAIIHFNPDKYQINGRSGGANIKERLTKLVELIQVMPEPKGFERIFMYYDQDSDDAELPRIAKEWDKLAVQVSRCL